MVLPEQRWGHKEMSRIGLIGDFDQEIKAHVQFHVALSKLYDEGASRDFIWRHTTL